MLGTQSQPSHAFGNQLTKLSMTRPSKRGDTEFPRLKSSNNSIAKHSSAETGNTSSNPKSKMI